MGEWIEKSWRGKRILSHADDDWRLHAILTRYALRCMGLDLNALIIIEGEPGSGKSSLSLRMAEILRDSHGFEFSLDNVFFDPVQFLDKATGDNQVFILEEGGVQAHARKFASPINIILSYYAQTSRFKNSITIVNLPDFEMIDRDLRRLVTGLWQAWVSVESKGDNLIIVQRRARVLKPVKVRGKERAFLRFEVDKVVDNKGFVTELDGLTWSLPSKNLWEEYLKLKREYWEAWRESWVNTLKTLREKQRGKKKTAKEILQEVIQKDPTTKEILFAKKSKEKRRLLERLSKTYDISLMSLYRGINQLKKVTSNASET